MYETVGLSKRGEGQSHSQEVPSTQYPVIIPQQELETAPPSLSSPLISQLPILCPPLWEVGVGCIIRAAR